jgi:preprotein translocase subunit SecD
MMKNVRWRVALTVAVIALSVWAFYPLDKKLNLGLDLKGGVHLVLRVQTDDALRSETETTVERLRSSLSRAGVQYTKLEATAADEFRVEGLSNDDAFRTAAAADAESVFDRNSGAGGYTYKIKPNVANQLREETVAQALQTIERRVNELGVAEPVIARQGADQILVELPGVSDVARAKSLISSTAVLQFRLVENGPFPTQEAALDSVNKVLPADSEILPGRQEAASSGSPTPATGFYIVKKVSVVTGNELRSASPGLDQFNRPAVQFTLKQDAAVRFGTFTQTNIGKPLGIILDKRVMSVATIQDRIVDNGQINGITRDEMQNLVITLKSGALPASLTYLEEQTIGPSLGEDSIRSGVTASIVGLAATTLFMLLYYRLSGVNAIVALVCNLIILLGLMAYVGFTMTLPGIAGFVLTMGIGVDSNVLIFERIKEELDLGRGVRASINAGFSRVFLTLLDTHISALIAAAFLFQFGTGPIRGFALTLTIGLISNLFTSTFVSKTLFELVLGRRQQVAALSI